MATILMFENNRFFTRRWQQEKMKVTNNNSMKSQTYQQLWFVGSISDCKF